MIEIDNKYFSKIIISKAIKLIENGFLGKKDLEKLSEKLGITILHLKKIFNKELNQTPFEYLESYKLLIAKNLLTNTNLNLSEISCYSGFKDFKLFNDLFKTKFELTPEKFRELHQNISLINDNFFVIYINYTKPFKYNELLGHLHYFCVKGIEKVENNIYYKAIHVKKNNIYINGYITVRNNEDEGYLEVTLTNSLIKVLPKVIFLVKNLFDLYSNPFVIFDGLKHSNSIINDCFEIGTRIPGSLDDFEICIRAIIGQLISMKNASDVLSEFCKKFGEKIDTDIEGIEYIFPTPEKINSIKKENIYDEICSLHITRSKVNAIMGITERFCNHTLDIENCVQPEEIINELLAIKGIGKWTADYIALRAINYSDILMNTDYNIRKILEKKRITDISIFNSFSPWRSHLTVGLYGLRDSVMDLPDKIYKFYYESPVGKLLIASKNNKIIGLWIEGQKHYLSNLKEDDMIEKNDHEMLLKTKHWLDNYFHCKPLHSLEDIVLAPTGTKLRQDLWNLLKTIPYGRFITFQNLTQKLIKKRGIKKISPSAIREAISHNPIAILIPCHRVIGTGGVNTGYAGGLKIKNFLTKLEQHGK